MPRKQYLSNSISLISSGSVDFVFLSEDPLVYADNYYSLNTASPAPKLENNYGYTQNVIVEPTVFGASAGSFRINESGAATYSIPISLPQGTAGVAPSLALSYSSQAGNGFMGVGWNLSGLASISRCRKTLAQDGVAQAITWDNVDHNAFCYDGERLKKISASQQGGTIQYVTEINDFTRITAYGPEVNPTYFTVEAKDGSISYFGNSDDSKQMANAQAVNSWSIKRFEDSVGNPIVFNYLQDSGSDFRIDKIEYAFGAGISAHAVVEFQYNDRPDVWSGYTAGYEFGTTKRLEKIIVKNSELSSGSTGLQEVRSYNLAYQRLSEDFWIKKSHITTIQECVGNQCLPATHFDWAMHGGLDFESDPVSSTNLIQNKSNLIQTIPFDVNGDGYLDVAWLESDEYHLDYHFDLRYAIYEPATQSFTRASFKDNVEPANCDNNDLLVEETFCENPNEAWEAVNVVPMDYNADGRQDLAVFRDKYDKWFIYLSSPSISAPGRWQLEGEPIEVSVNAYNTTLLDSNADGLMDILASDGANLKIYPLVHDHSTTDSSSRPYHYDLSQGLTLDYVGFTEAFTEPTSGVARIEKALIGAGDFNGDGIGDLIIADRRIVEVEIEHTGGQSNTTTTLGLNYDMQENYYIAYIDGEDTVRAGTFLGASHKHELVLRSTYDRSQTPAIVNFQSADINGDGYSDILREVEGGSEDDYYELLLNTGAGFLPPQTVFTTPEREDIQVQLMDLNSDGFADFQYRNKEYGIINYKLWRPESRGFGDRELIYAGHHRAGREERFMIYDATADGHVDLVHFEDNDLKLKPNVHSGATGMVQRITNGLGAVIELDYEQLAITESYTGVEDLFLYVGSPTFVNIDDFYTALNAPFAYLDGGQNFANIKPAPIMDYKSPLYLVTEMRSSSPAANEDSANNVNVNAIVALQYRYEDARFQAAGRGFLGFKQLTTIDTQTGVITETDYRQDWPFIGLPEKTAIHMPGFLKTLSVTTNTYEIND